MYTVPGLNIEGKKEIPGLYLSETEGASFWLSVLTDLNSRGIEDILIASVDGLKGFPEAINAICPQTEVQLCVIHQIRNSTKYVASAIEAIHRKFRNPTQAKGAFPNENSLLKLLYAGIQNASKKWTMPLQNRSLTLSQLSICFDDRLEDVLHI